MREDYYVTRQERRALAIGMAAGALLAASFFNGPAIMHGFGYLLDVMWSYWILHPVDTL